MPLATALAGVLFLAACEPSYKPGLPPGSPFVDQGPAHVTHGVAAGDVTADSALIWTRTTGPAQVRVTWQRDEERVGHNGTAEPAGASATASAVADRDFTVLVPVQGLTPDTRYRYRVEVAGASDVEAASVSGRFSTAPAERANEVFLWSGDLGGQGMCRQGPEGYPIFDVMLRSRPAFMIMLGDLVYADGQCSTPPNAPGSDFAATTLATFRAKHRYQREAPALRRFLADVPVYAIWDDHEVRNNFGGRADALMPLGRQALLEYWPIRTPPEEPGRLYRKISRGPHLDLFILDTRQYRSPNGDADGPAKTMLGEAQRAWLLRELPRSTATWKVIVSSVPIANPKAGSVLSPGNDSWARGDDGTGFQHELRAITGAIVSTPVRNVVWLAADVHYVQAAAFDPNRDGTPDFAEFIAGPLSAAAGRLLPPQADLHPTVWFAETGYSNFGRVTVNRESFAVDVVDYKGDVRFSRTLTAK
jgi:alkaline phosphatase D